MPLCGFNRKMIEGLAIYSEGLFEATIERGHNKGVNDQNAVEDEIEEIKIFLEALKSKYKAPENNSKKIAEMIYGIAIFSGALFQSAIKKCNNGDGIDKKYYEQVEDICTFLEELENTHQELRKVNSQKDTMIKAVQWIDENDRQ